MKGVFEEVKRRIRLSEWLPSHYGIHFNNSKMAECPFHKERTPSFHLTSDEVWHCFSCGEGGDIFDLVQKLKNYSLMEATRELAGEVGVEISKEEVERINAFKALQAKNERMLDKAKQDLSDDMGADTYLSGRGITKEAVEHFGLGFRPDANAISIPIHDRMNRLVGYSLRLITPGPDEPKYKNSKADELGLFQKREILYHLGAARPTMKKRVYIAEGYFDVIALWQAGFTNSIGICQAIMTKEQAKILHDIIGAETEIVFVPDNDRAGLDALQKNLALCRAYSKDRSIKACVFHGAKDAGEALQASGDVAKNFLEKAEPAEKVVLDLILKDEPDRAKQYQLVKPVVSAVSALLRDDLAGHLAEKWDKDRKVVASYIGAENADATPNSFADTFQLAEDYLAYVKDVRRNGVRIGIPGIDRLVRRIAPGEVCVIQARASVGKTALGLNILGHLSKQEVPTLFFSLEQPRAQIYERMLQISNRKAGAMVENMAYNMDPGMDEMHEQVYNKFRFISVCDQGGMTLQRIHDYIAQFSAINKKPQVVMIDYFGYIKRGKDESKDQYEAVSERAKKIKDYAKEMNNSWIVLHQLSRAGGSGGEPVTMDMGRDSGVVEESADHLFGAWRPELEKEISDDERAKRVSESVFMLAVLKNRSGPTGLTKLHFEKRTLTIGDFDASQHSRYGTSDAPPSSQGDLGLKHGEGAYE